MGVSPHYSTYCINDSGKRENWGEKIGDGSDDPLLEKRPFSTRETLKRWKREDVRRKMYDGRRMMVEG